MTSEIFAYLILPILIFCARVMDVSLGTIRIIFISKGFRYLAPVIGFVEVLIWLMAISQIFQDINNPIYYIAYAGGFSAGTFVGMFIDSKLLLGTQVIRIITRKKGGELVRALKKAGYSVTSSLAESNGRRVRILYTIIDRYDVKNVIKIIKKYNSQAFYSIEDVRFVSERITSKTKWGRREKFRRLTRPSRNTK